MRGILSFIMTSMMAGALLAGCAGTPATPETNLRQQVIDTEKAFAATMARRDFGAFAEFLSDEAIFIYRTTTLRGKSQVAASWRRHFEAPAAPFSWEPDQVEVLPSGNLALSSGPVHAPDGKLIGRFTSIWRLEAGGRWRIVFDQGNSP